jgi:hypothetical protein
MKIAVLHYGLIQDYTVFKTNYNLVYKRFFSGIDLNNVDKYFITTSDVDKNIFEGLENIKHIHLDDTEISECEHVIQKVLNFKNNKNFDIKNISLNKIKAIIYKNYRLKIGYDIIESYKQNYDIIMCLRSDCKFMLNFDKSQIYDAMCDDCIYTLGPHWWRPIDELDCSPNDEHNEELVNNGQLFYGLDFFFASPKIIKIISRLYDNIEMMYNNNIVRNFHDETIYQDFIRYNKIYIKLIKWNPFLTEEDFSSTGLQFGSVNKSYLPTLVNRYFAIRT